MPPPAGERRLTGLITPSKTATFKLSHQVVCLQKMPFACSIGSTEKMADSYITASLIVGRAVACASGNDRKL